MAEDRHLQGKPYPLRLRPEVRVALEAAAAQGRRSLHAEIVERIDGSFVPREASQAASEILGMLRAEIQGTKPVSGFPPKVLRLAEVIAILPDSKIDALSELLGVALDR